MGLCKLLKVDVVEDAEVRPPADGEDNKTKHKSRPFEDIIVDIQNNCYLLDSKIPIYVIADNSKKYENINNSQMQKINNFNEFKIVFINKN